MLTQETASKQDQYTPVDLVFVSSSKRFRSNWFSIILHSGQIVFMLFLILDLVLGLA